MTGKDNSNSHLLPVALRRARAAVRGEKSPADDNGEANLSQPDIFPVSAALTEDKSVGKHTAKAEQGNGSQVGKMVQGKGVYLGATEIKDRKGASLGVYDIYAAPEDLMTSGVFGGGKRLKATFNKAVSQVAGLKDYYGHKGFYHGGDAPEKILFNALRGGYYRGQWFLPTKDIMDKLLYPNKDKGDLAYSFVTKCQKNAHWYWTCSDDEDGYVIAKDFTRGRTNPDKKDTWKQSVRCVRAEPRP